MRSHILALLIAFFTVGAFAADAPAKFKVSEFTFARPEKWGWVETTSPMRKAQLKVANPTKGETDGEVVFFHFGQGQGGDTKANIDRWLGQFQEPRDQLKSKTEEVTVGARKVTYVQAEGTYLSGMPGGARTAQPASMLLGAILDSEDGSVFVKFTAPAAVAKSAQPDFRKMVEGALGKK